MQIHNLKRKHKNKKDRLVGRGGKHAKTSGRGGKGQTARAGNKRRPELRDIIKKLPKNRGYQFKSIQKVFVLEKDNPKTSGTKREENKNQVTTSLTSHNIMQNFWNKIKLIWTDPILRKRVLFVFFALIVFRLLSAVPIPGIDTMALNRFLSNNQFFGILNIFSGGGLSNLSIIMLGVGPYITGSIIMQLLTIMVPALKRIYHEEGEAGRKRFAQYSRLLTVPLAAIQGFSLLAILEQQNILFNLTAFDRITNLFIVVAGSVLIMWIGELVSEFGIGNGVSLLIFAGIVSRLPSWVSQNIFTFDVSQIPLYLVFLVVGGRYCACY